MGEKIKYTTEEDYLNLDLISKTKELSDLFNQISDTSSYDTYVKELMKESTEENNTITDTMNFKTKIKISNKSQFKDENYPCYANPGDSGFDLKADITEEIILKPLERMLIPTGIYVDLPDWCEIQVRPKSGITLKKGLLCSLGTVDSQYIGNIGVTVFNLSNENVTISIGEKIAQCVISNVLNSNFVELVNVETINKKTVRGENGWGSTGKF